MAIQHGDQYILPFKIKIDCEIITPEDCDDVKIKIGKYEKSYSLGELIFNSNSKTWGFPLTQAMSNELSIMGTMYQVGVKFAGQDIINSRVAKIDVASSIIAGEWEE